MDWDWHKLRQQGFLTIAIVLGSSLIVTLLVPNFTWRQVVLLIAVLALLLGWLP